MKRSLAVAVQFTILMSSLAATLSAQGVQTGTLRGTITDQQGAAVPGATITISSPALQGLRTTVSDTAGNYSFVQLPPGDYTVKVEITSFAPLERTARVPLGGTIEQNVTLTLAGVTEQVSVVGQVPPPLTTPVVGLNIKHEEVEALATSRTLAGITTLSPGVNEATPNVGQVSINGAFAYDNNFMLNGVDVTDNIFGTPQNLFIEDAIEETQVLTSGISAEYGRFSGGVVNAITKSGGNTFSGSYRLNLTNPSWIQETPFEVSRGVSHEDITNKIHEATFGGPIARDRLWFFSSARLANTSTAGTLSESGFGYTTLNDNKRGEIKVTASPSTNHTIQAGYLNNASTVENTSGLIDLILDPAGLITRSLPNWYTYGNYRGVLKNNLLVEAQYSERRFEFQGEGGTSTNILESPFYSGAVNGVYNAPYFDATDPEQRNNRQFTGNVTSFIDRGGRHEVKVGYEFFRSQNTGGNSQSSTNYVFDADYATNASGAPVYDAQGRFIPIFVPGETQLEHWIPVRGAELNVNNHSLFAQDHWTINRNVSADAGVRFERVRSEATGNLIGVDTNTIVPRLALAYDVNGDGRWLLHTTYGHYAGRYSEAQIGKNSNVSNPDLTVGIYGGPAGQGRSFAPGFDTSNYDVVFGQFPTANVSMVDNLSAPITKEFTASAGGSLNRQAYAELTYIHRRTSNVIEDFIDLSNGTTHVVRDGLDVGTFTNVVFRNRDFGHRDYDAMVLQGRYNLMNNLTLNGHWTVQLRNEGNFEGEAANQPAISSTIGDYPEAFSEARNYPTGRLSDFQRHRARIWAIYNVRAGRAGDFSVSGLWRYEGAQSYSLRATNQPLTDIQLARLAAYPDSPASQTIYFGGRGTELFNGYSGLDFSINYNIPVFRQFRPYFKFDLFNALNNDKLVSWNTTVRQDPASPVDELGIATGYVKGAAFGTGTANTNYPQSLIGTGLRGFRVAFGVRF
jgi:hypothetical protein